MRIPKRILGGAALFMTSLVLWGCVPSTVPTDVSPKVAVINAPAGDRFLGLASTFEAEVGVYGLPNFQFASATRLRFREVRMDFTAARAARQAAMLAGSFGAELAVLISAPVMEREVETFEASNRLVRRVESTLQVRVIIVDVASASVVHTALSQTYVGERFEDADEPLARPRNDPTLLGLQSFAVNELAPGLLTVLSELSAAL